MFGKKKPLLSTENIAGQLYIFAELHLNKPRDFWNNVLWADETKVETSGLNVQDHVC